MSKIFVVSGISHSVSESAADIENLTIREHTRLQNWVKQWTTPNNTLDIVNTNSAQSAVLFWKKTNGEHFGYPSDLSKNAVAALRFTVKITAFSDGVEESSVSVPDVQLDLN